jgi:heme exporter protein D
MENPSEASLRESLDAIERGRAAAIAHARAPWWYYLGMGVNLAAVGMIFIFGSPLLNAMAAGGFTITQWLLQQAYRRTTGTRLSEARNGLAILWLVAWMVAAFGSGALAFYLWTAFSLIWPAFIAALITVLGSIVCGRLFERAVRRRASRTSRISVP